MKVLEGLATKGPKTPRDLSKELDLAPRTVTYALQRLLRWKLCRKMPNLSDMRQPLYALNPQAAELLRRYGLDTAVREMPSGIGGPR
ncbi:MAG: hypothetical protein HXY34_09275 [Candidatus Thorarchaeota archaeon]|nr:hypothetical protein [Candidatus Thorarchaeota archaeon]